MYNTEITFLNYSCFSQFTLSQSCTTNI